MKIIPTYQESLEKEISVKLVDIAIAARGDSRSVPIPRVLNEIMALINERERLDRASWIEEMREKRNELRVLIEDAYDHDYDWCRYSQIEHKFVCKCKREERINEGLDDIIALLTPSSMQTKNDGQENSGSSTEGLDTESNFVIKGEEKCDTHPTSFHGKIDGRCNHCEEEEKDSYNAGFFDGVKAQQDIIEKEWQAQEEAEQQLHIVNGKPMMLVKCEACGAMKVAGRKCACQSQEEGDWIDEKCPQCGSTLLALGKDKWCSLVYCDWWDWNKDWNYKASPRLQS